MTAENVGLYEGNIQKWRLPCVARENAKRGTFRLAKRSPLSFESQGFESLIHFSRKLLCIVCICFCHFLAHGLNDRLPQFFQCLHLQFTQFGFVVFPTVIIHQITVSADSALLCFSAYPFSIPSVFPPFIGIPQKFAENCRHCCIILPCQCFQPLILRIGQPNRNTGLSLFAHRQKTPFDFFTEI